MSLRPLLVEEIRRQRKTDKNYHPANELSVEAACHARTEITADNRRCRHTERVMPDNFLFDDEDDDSNAVDQKSKKGFDCVHAVDITYPHESESTEHQNADAGAEVASVYGHEKLKEHQ